MLHPLILAMLHGAHARQAASAASDACTQAWQSRLQCAQLIHGYAALAAQRMMRTFRVARYRGDAGGAAVAVAGVDSCSSGTGEVSTGSPSAAHAGKPPSSTATLQHRASCHASKEAMWWEYSSDLVNLDQARLGCSRHQELVVFMICSVPLVPKSSEGPPHTRRTEYPRLIIQHHLHSICT
jgi:hypothetical protein